MLKQILIIGLFIVTIGISAVNAQPAPSMSAAQPLGDIQQLHQQIAALQQQEEPLKQQIRSIEAQIRTLRVQIIKLGGGQQTSQTTIKPHILN